MSFFKIRNKDTGLFSPGGTYAKYASWSQGGKMWNSIGALRAHLTLIGKNGGIPLNWEVVEYKMIELSAKQPAEYIDPKKLLEKLKG